MMEIIKDLWHDFKEADNEERGMILLFLPILLAGAICFTPIICLVYGLGWLSRKVIP